MISSEFFFSFSFMRRTDTPSREITLTCVSLPKGASSSVTLFEKVLNYEEKDSFLLEWSPFEREAKKCSLFAVGKKFQQTTF